MTFDPILATLLLLCVVAVIGVGVGSWLQTRSKSLGQGRKFGPRHGLKMMKRRGY